MHLNEKQKEAVEKITGPLLIIAWAGSWKTATLTARVQNMIQNHNIAPKKILCVTFTNKAAREMKERIAKSLWLDTANINTYRNSHVLPFIGTFHSFWVSVLKEFIEVLGYKKDFVIYDSSDSLSLVKQIWKEMQLEEKEYPPKKIHSYISNAKNSLISPAQYATQVDSHFKEIVHEVYQKYQKRLEQNNALDFDDILVKTHTLLRNEQILSQFWERFEYIMVDEYQDTNITQYEIIKMLASKNRNLAVVGDDWQSIYSWRWADMRNILHFEKDYPEAKLVKLEQNYRSTKKIIAAANEVIKNNKNALKKELWTDNVDGDHITLIHAPDDRTEAGEIAKIIKEEGRPYSKNLILYRTNGQSRQIEEYLIRENIPYKVVGGLKFYDRMEVKDIMAYLKVFYNSSDSISFKRIINVPGRKIGARSVEILDEYKNNFGLNYIDILENVEDIDDLRGGAKIALADFFRMYQDLKQQIKVSESLSLFTDYILQKIGYKEYLKTEYSEDEYNAKIENLDELLNVLTTYDGIDTVSALGQFIDEVSLLTDMDEVKEDADFVTLMTIHTSKWLERENVFIAGVEDGIMPHIRTIGKPEELEEERRLMYVAMTRAKEKLYISTAKERFQFWEYIRNPKSRFLEEIPVEHMLERELSWGNFFESSNSSSFGSLFGSNAGAKEGNYTPIKKPKVDNDVTSFSLWDRVNHPKFWNGIITALSWENADIAFSGQGIKKMNIKIAPVRKI